MYDSEEDEKTSDDGKDGELVDAKAKNAKDEEGNISGKEERERGAVGWRVYGAYVRAGGGMPALLLVCLVFSLDNGSRAFMDYWLSFWAEDEFEFRRSDFFANHVENIITNDAFGG